MTPRYCRPCDVTRADAPWDNPARSWRNAATWTPELEAGA